MSDTIDMYREMKADRKEERALIARTNIAEMKVYHLMFAEAQPGVWKWSSRQGTVTYWPSANKWGYRGAIFRGTVLQLADWMRERRFIA